MNKNCYNVSHTMREDSNENIREKTHMHTRTHVHTCVCACGREGFEIN
jgi:hypothetical protein